MNPGDLRDWDMLKTRRLSRMVTAPCPNCEQPLRYHEAHANGDRCPKCDTPVVWAWTVYPPSKHGHWVTRGEKG